ncbi:hypothetical protein POM88_008321 [Heracleum sosnowskyi]|uniref:Helitron helicase-like domain-containing protein n=1 Tax=Heracleum sosnowskyi TaxID=360622 RepID=A0AAD8J8F2_9APIA|nr:hypothetical protein POM88_008321 [Heracleum sosnowskyi]
MKEGNYNHLRLDNFNSLQQEFAILCSTPINEFSKCGRKGFTPTSLDESYTLNSHNYVTPHGKDNSLRVPLSNISKKLGSGLENYGISSRQEFKTTFSSIDKQHQTNKKKSAPAIVSSYTPLKKPGESSEKTPLLGFLCDDYDLFLDDVNSELFSNVYVDCQLGNKKQKIDHNLSVESSSNFVESILDVGECNSFILDNSSTSGLLFDGDEFFCDDDDVFVDNEITVDNVESNLNEITRACSADGYHEEIPYIDPENQNKKKRKRITMKEYYSYKLQVRRNEGMTVRLGGRLFQQYVVDAFSCIEQSRLWWLRTHQKNLRNDLYKNIAKKAATGNVDTSTTGKEIDKLLKSIGKSLKQFNQLPQPPPCYLQAGTNNLVLEEASYNVTEMEDEFEKLFKNLNAEQLQVYQHVLQSVQTKVGGNGTVSPPSDCLEDYEEDEILIPSNFCDPELKNSIENMIQWTYPDFSGAATNITSNVVYKEVFYNLPVT